MLYPWPWIWDASLSKWLSAMPYLASTQTGRLTNNGNAAIALTSPLTLDSYAKEIQVRLSKASGAGYALSFRKIATDSTFGPVFATLSLSAGAEVRANLSQPIAEFLSDCHALDYTLTVPSNGNARATIQVVTHAIRPILINEP